MRLMMLLVLLTTTLAFGEEPANAPVVAADPAQGSLLTDAEWNHSSATVQKTSEPGSPGMAVVKLMAALAVVLAIAVTAALVLKKVGVRRIMPGKGRHLEVIETVPLAFKRSVSLVRLGDQVLVIGNGEHELTHLATMPASVITSVESAAKAAVEPASAPADQGFRATLDNLLGKRR
jgi:flagellar biosynthetic protein FliO